MRKLVAVAATASMLAGGLGAAAAPAVAAVIAHSSASAPKAGSITWGTCSESDLQSAGAQCGLLAVPLNYSNPTGPTIQISVSIIRHTSAKAHYKGIILTNPGGPGGSGLDLNVFLIEELQAEQGQKNKTDVSFDKAAIGDYDWVGFDPRGVGTSVPSITCQPNYFSGDRRSYNPRNKSILTYWLKRTKSYATACATHSSAQLALLHNMTTRDSARDMNSIRQALGQNKISYYGFSYGTYLGQVYATMFPAHVRRLILDSNVDPRNVWYKANLNQDVAFQHNIEIWFSWLAKYHKFYHLGQTRAAVQRRFNTVEASLAKHPIKGKVGPDEWVDIFLEAGYYQLTWLQLGQAFASWANTHSAAAGNNLVTLYQDTDGPGNDNEFAVYNAVQCTDVQWPLSWAKWSKDNHRVNKIAPFETWGNAWFNAPCLYWPAPASTPTHVNGSKIGGTLLIDETGDAATPFEGSREVRRLFPHSVLLAEPGGTTHADSLFGDLCVDNTIARYLANGKLPMRSTNKNARWDTTCKPLPVPVPTNSASVAGAASSQSISNYAKVLNKVRGLQRAA
jgi:pimeloyl-ACP methyl ester carboxylesterase